MTVRRDSRTSQPGPGGTAKPARAALVQCDRCKATGTGRVNAAGKVSSVNLPARAAGNSWTHLDCGGCFRAFDIAPQSEQRRGLPTPALPRPTGFGPATSHCVADRLLREEVRRGRF